MRRPARRGRGPCRAACRSVGGVPNDLEGGAKLLEEVLPRPEKIGCQGLERASKELQAVLQQELLSPAQPQLLFHSLADEVDVDPIE